MSLYDLFFTLTRVEIHLWNRVDEALRAEVDVPLGRFEALLVMRRLGPCRILDISRELAVTVGGTSKLVDRLETTGLCRREPNPDDRRSSLVHLSETASGVLDHGESVIDTTLRSLLAVHLRSDEIASLGTTLHTLRHGLGARPAVE